MIFRQQALHLMNHMKLLSVHNKIQQEKERKQQFDIYQEGSSPILFKIDSLNNPKSSWLHKDYISLICKDL